MSREELRYRGPLDVDGELHHVDVWAAGDTAVVFDGSTKLAVLRGMTVGHTDDRRIVFEGNRDGDDVRFEGPDPERVTVRFGGASIDWPDGSKWRAATVAQTQYGTLVSVSGQEHRFLPGARIEMVGMQRWIVDGSTRLLADAGRTGGCGCGK